MLQRDPFHVTSVSTLFMSSGDSAFMARFNGDIVVLWALLAVGVAGLLLGIWFRAPALAFVAAIVALTNIAVALAGDWSLQRAAISISVLLVGLSFAYLLGLFISFTWSKMKKFGVFDD